MLTVKTKDGNFYDIICNKHAYAINYGPEILDHIAV